MQRSAAPPFPLTRTDQPQPNRPDLFFDYASRPGRWIVWADAHRWVVYLAGSKLPLGWEDVRDGEDRRLRPFDPE
jgi:hypothetical protein